MYVTPFMIAKRFLGLKEVSGVTSNEQILAMLKLDNDWPEDDSVPWCSAFVNYVAWLLDLERTKSLRARSWLKLPNVVSIEKAMIGHDVVILKRSGKNQPEADVINAPGHVGFFAGFGDKKILILGGNQKDSVSIEGYPYAQVLGIRRLL